LYRVTRFPDYPTASAGSRMHQIIMTDHLSPSQRSSLMAAVRSKHTQPELIVRSLIHRLGFRFRLHVKNLPGTPDIVLPRLRKIVLVNGCLWHGHRDCSRAVAPKSNQSFWRAKIASNRQRDRQVLKKLENSEWKVLTVWQCQLRSKTKLQLLEEQITDFLRN
jgi:DNA mismatch endonuclease (patch repair protein)